MTDSTYFEHIETEPLYGHRFFAYTLLLLGIAALVVNVWLTNVIDAAKNKEVAARLTAASQRNYQRIESLGKGVPITDCSEVAPALRVSVPEGREVTAMPLKSGEEIRCELVHKAFLKTQIEQFVAIGI